MENTTSTAETVLAVHESGRGGLATVIVLKADTVPTTVVRRCDALSKAKPFTAVSEKPTVTTLPGARDTQVEVQAPGGKRSYQIVGLVTLHESAGAASGGR